MEIIAVIPARAGSRGIPNKNIRLLNGKPLISYAIENAQTSKYIDKVLVTSDSPEIALICKNMAVEYLQRDKALCDEATTLDAVVYDAIKDMDCDIVITMQPTSPTLRVETLDKAIEFFMKNSLDTLISVFNQPRLSWKREGEKIYPVYKERVNRQYLPDEYAETGAFLITNRKSISSNTRIGKNVEVFPVTAEEAVDIDDYADLHYAAMVLSQKRIIIFTNGNDKVGLGHISRALELADEFYCKPDILYDYNMTDVKMFGDTKHHLVAVDGFQGVIRYLKEHPCSLFINDILSTTLKYMQDLKNVNANMKIINFEDLGNGATTADLVINALYNDSHEERVKVGKEYYIAPKKFLFAKPIEVQYHVKNIFICFGGADPQNYTERVLNIVKENTYSNYNFYVAVGRAYRYLKKVMKYNQFDNIHVYSDVENMPDLMSKCDVAITSRGRTCYELALLGIPSLSMAQNKREEQHKFACIENGFVYIGLNPEDSFIEANIEFLLNLSPSARRQMHEAMLSINLKDGRKRIMSLINNL